ncbi:response regulator [Magnetovibrio sp. PR-2]|uniref:response regulator n=1 Tax=Magnetovibrio sp. PR-2 TaxID=3120356 RepID=UPI002FCE20A5
MGRILVIDDDPDIRSLLSKFFTVKGHLVMEAEDGAHGIGLATTSHPDVVILDMEMPVLDGYSTLNILRHSRRIPQVPVVVLTAKTDADLRSDCENAGCTDYITKPFDMDHLQQTIDERLKAGGVAYTQPHL